MANVTRSSRKLKDEETNSSKKGHIDGKKKDPKGSTTSDSATTDTSGLRRSTRETPSKKHRTSSPLNTQKFRRPEKQMPETPTNRKSERVVKQRIPSPPKRSERGKMHRSSSSLSSKKSEKSSSSMDTKTKKEKREKLEKEATLQKRDQKTAGVRLQKQKRLDARSYRSFFKPQGKRLDACSYKSFFKPHGKSLSSNESDLAEKCKRHEKSPQGCGNCTKASGSKNVEDEEECSGRKGNELIGKKFGEGGEGAVEGSTSDSSKLAEGNSMSDSKLELPHFGKKRKLFSQDIRESKHRDGSPVANYSDRLQRSSPSVVVAKGVDDVERAEEDCSEREDLSTAELIESASYEGRPSAVHVNLLNTGLRKLSEGTSIDDEKMELAHFSMNYNSKEADKSSEGEFSVREDLKASELMGESTLSGKVSVTVDVDLESGGKDDNFRRKRKAPDHDADMSFTTASRDACSAEAVSSSPSGSKRSRILNICIACSKEQRVEYDSQNQEVCCCNANIAISKDRRGLEVRENIGASEECGGNAQLKEFSLDLQTDRDHNACVICKLGGKILRCGGKECRRSYHLSCLDPPLKDVPFGIWHCLWCVKKKIELGAHSVSEGVESIWDVREVEVPYPEGMQKEKQYFVKYKGLAHVHNRWIPENKLLLEAPILVAKFNKTQQKEKVGRWKLLWTVPQRLLQKRLLMSPKQADEYLGGNSRVFSYCQHEWLVKWNGLGYDNATWELENAPFLSSPKSILLIRDYECRHEKPKKGSDSSGICPPELDNDHLNFVNKLREYWHKGQNAVIIDDQERMMKVILFILSLHFHSDACRPFLITSTSAILSVWEAEFMRLAPSVNVVFYTGDRDIRKSIQTVEFYNEGGCVMFQVLLSPPDAIIEDFDSLECIGWEAIIVDECQRLRVPKLSEQIRMLASDFRIILSGQIKDNISEYRNLLSFADSGGEGICIDGLKTDSNDNTGILAAMKERLAQYLAYESKSDSSKFVEYWVPVQLSNVQLEQYCATLVSNSMSLRSCSKNDSVGALRDILISLRKCCDHPYLLDESLQTSLTKGRPEVEYLDVGVNASGKLQLLDKFLLEIKNRGLRALILFQSMGRSGRISIGDILDDFVRQRFGADSYERVESGLIMQKKQAAMNMFNNKESGRFVFLIENRACLPSIKLSSVDTVIIFDSDWNPLNDLRALQKINVHSDFEPLKVFRLYSSFTVEEKVLIFAKQDIILESNIQYIICSTCHMLLIWGASYLFNKLDGFHNNPSLVSEISCEPSLLNEVMLELLSQLPHTTETDGPGDCSVILKVEQSGATYSRNISLLGEQENQSQDEEPSHIFWTRLLEGKYPRWRYSSSWPSQRARKKVQYFDGSPMITEVENEVKKKGKKVNSAIDPLASTYNRTPCLLGKMKNVPGAYGTQADKESQCLPGLKMPTMAHDISAVPVVHSVKYEGRRKLLDVQEDLLLLLKPEMLELCETFQLPADIKAMVQKFLEYIINYHRVIREPTAVLQAFQIALCWTAASFLKYKVNHKESFALAKRHLNFECKEEEVESIYKKLHKLKKKFLHRNASEFSSQQGLLPVPENVGISTHQENLNSSEQKLKQGDITESSGSHKFVEQGSNGNEPQKNESNRKIIKRVGKTCSRRARKILLTQLEEAGEFNKIWDAEKEKLKKARTLEWDHICSVHNNLPVRLDKLKVLNREFARKMDELDRRMGIHQRELAEMQLNARNEEERIRAYWLQEAKSGRLLKSFADLPLTLSGYRMESLETNEQGGVCEGLENSVLHSGFSPEQQNSGGIVFELENSAEPLVEELVANEAFEEMGTRTVTLPVISSVMNVVNGNDGVGNGEDNSDGGDSINSMQQGRIVPPSLAQAHLNSSHDSSMSALQVPLLEHDQLNLSTGLRIEPVPICEEQNSPQQIVEVPTLQPVDIVQYQVEQTAEQAPIEPIQLELSPTTASEDELDTEQQTEVATQNRTRAIFSSQAEQLNNPVFQSVTQLQLPSLTGLDLGRSLVSDSRNTGVLPESGAHAPQTFPATTRLPQVFHPDPLQNELARIRVAEEHAIKLNEDEKLRLKSECEKELEEVRQKYDNLIQGADVALIQKRKTFEANYNKVFLNHMLAESFKFRFTDARAGSRAVQQGAPASFVHQFLQQSGQPITAPRPGWAPAPAPPLQVVHHSSALISNIPRAPAPHLRHSIRPFASTLGPNLPTPPNHRSLDNPVPTSAIYQSTAFSRTYLPEGSGVSPVFNNPSLSALELLMDAEDHHLPPLPDAFDPSAPVAIGQAAATVDIVCLSDDD